MPTEAGFKNLRLWIWVVTIGGALIRILTLTRESFWNDEAFSGWITQHSFADLMAIARTDPHPPGHLMLGWAWGQAFGTSDFSLRLISALAGICLIPVTFQLGKRLYDERVGFIGAILIAFLTQSIYYSQEFRAYIMLALLAAVSAVLIFDVIEAAAARATLPMWKPIALALVLVVNAYQHYFGLLFSLMAIGYLLLRTAKMRSLVAIPVSALVLLVLSYLPWIPEIAHASHMHSHPTKPGPKDILLLPNELIGPGFILVALAGLIVAAGLVKLKSSPEEWKPSDWRLVGWILIPLAFAVVVSYVKVPIYTPRNLFFALAPVCLLLARAIATITPHWKTSLGIVAGFLVVHYGLQVKSKGYFVHATKQQLREVSRYVLEHKLPDELVEVVGWDESNIGYYFNQAGQGQQLSVIPLAEGHESELPTHTGTFWRISAGVPLPDRKDIERNYQILDEADFLQAHAIKLQGPKAIPGTGG